MCDSCIKDLFLEVVYLALNLYSVILEERHRLSVNHQSILGSDLFKVFSQILSLLPLDNLDSACISLSLNILHTLQVQAASPHNSTHVLGHLWVIPQVLLHLSEVTNL